MVSLGDQAIARATMATANTDNLPTSTNSFDVTEHVLHRE